ncbi:family 78 glycoside hydrolase catalytic domain [Kineococcus terrestris]|uniref:alpha-L-rhamnosidase n=1 Tax=Kineococcus terrestris TaxID=2044856 RepID=UPI003F68AC7A
MTATSTTPSSAPAPVTDWRARMVAAADDHAGAPLLRGAFRLDGGHGEVRRAALHVTALGVVEPVLDGVPIADEVLTPGWSSYEWRLRYRIHDVTERLRQDARGEHVLGLALGRGWAVGRLGWTGRSGFYADRPAALAQLEVEFADGHRQVVATDATWTAGPSAVLANDLYDGQTVDARRDPGDWAVPGAPADGWGPVEEVPFDTARLTPHAGPPVRRQEVVRPQRVWTSPAGELLLDLGQNLVGWLSLRVRGEAGQEVVVRHAEVLEHDELGVRPLRSAAATDRFVLSGGDDGFEPTFTFHGFRYAGLTGWPGGEEGLRRAVDAGDVEAVVVHSDLRRTGEFGCSHELLEQFHRNVVWGLRGNFLDVPTDCPQRDERLGWTGDLSAFAPTAAYLYDVSGFLRDWLADLRAEQRAAGGMVAFVVPDVLKFQDRPGGLPAQESTALWSDAAVWVPWALWQAYGDREVLAESFGSMAAHVDRVESLLSPTGLWDTGFQFGDWLDPQAPPEDPFRARADPGVVATACAFRSAHLVAQAAALLGRDGDAQRYGALAERLRTAFGEHYVGQDGTVTSDCPTVYALAVVFGLLDGEVRRRAGDRLAELVAGAGHRIATGFAGTPFVTDALTLTGHLDDAYRLLLQTECPSWLYPVTMGATTVWERWDSMLPDGTVNPGEMTSFNHYALGAVADWVHRTVAGLAPLEPGYRRSLVAPRPGGGLTWARGALQTPHGRLAVAWEFADGPDGGRELVVDVEVPAGTSALVRLPGRDDEELGAGVHRLTAPGVAGG